MTAAIRDTAAVPRSTRLVYWVSIAYIVVDCVGLIFTVVNTVVECLPGALLRVTLPVSIDYPPASGAVSYSGSPYVQQGTPVTMTEASVTVSHAPLISPLMTGLGEVFEALTGIAVAFCVMVLARQVLAQRPFVQQAVRALTIAAIALGVGSTLSTVCARIGVSALGDTAYVGKYGHFSVAPLTSIGVDFVPLVIALALLALAAAFRAGATMQREVEDLV